MRPRTTTGVRGTIWTNEDLQNSIFAFSLSCQHPGERLNIGKRHAVAERAVLIIGVGRGKSRLRVDNFENCGFSVLVAQRGEPEAVCRQFRSALQSRKLIQ